MHLHLSQVNETIVRVIEEPPNKVTKKRGPKQKFSPEEKQKLIDFVCFSYVQRRATYSEIGLVVGICETIVRKYLLEFNFHRRVARKKIFISEDNARHRVD